MKHGIKGPINGTEIEIAFEEDAHLLKFTSSKLEELLSG